tara:strand:- start:1254 stop:1667 length:414 start_codon:yes stop_codon:yes gene_type:complete
MDDVKYFIKKKNIYYILYMNFEQFKRPWGFYINLTNEDGYKVKKLTINPNSRLSLQSHNHRSEHWTVIKGQPQIQVGGDKLNLEKNHHVYIPKKTLHRIENNTDEIVEIIEVQIGDYLEEDDIIRYEDDYNRKILSK